MQIFRNSTAINVFLNTTRRSVNFLEPISWKTLFTEERRNEHATVLDLCLFTNSIDDDEPVLADLTVGSIEVKHTVLDSILFDYIDTGVIL